MRSHLNLDLVLVLLATAVMRSLDDANSSILTHSRSRVGAVHVPNKRRRRKEGRV